MTGGPSSSVHPTVLVVEDDPSLRTFYRSALQIAGFAVVTAEDGIAALRLIDGSVPEAVVLDLGLPYLSGWDVGREVAARLPHLPVVVVTGSTEDIDTRQYACVLRKPITALALIDAVEGCLRKHLWRPTPASTSREGQVLQPRRTPPGPRRGPIPLRRSH